jgi:hypothetical protein
MKSLGAVLLIATIVGSQQGAAFAQKPTDWAARQIYWDGTVALPLEGATCDEKKSNLRARYGNPPLMAIGDSLYNGVQSLRINWWLAEWSAPVFAAMRLHLIDEFRADRTGVRDFYVPQYPTQSVTQNYGFNLEDLNVNIGNQLAVQGTALFDLAFNYKPPNRRPVVENLAFSGANTIDLLDWKISDFKRYAGTFSTRLKSRGTVGNWLELKDALKDLSDAFFFANAS